MEELISVQLNVQQDSDTATSAFVKRMRQHSIRPKLRIDGAAPHGALSRVVQSCTKRWQDQLNRNDSFRIFLNGVEIVDHSTTLQSLVRQGGTHRVDDRRVLTLTYAMRSTCREPPSAEGEQDCDGEDGMQCATTTASAASLPVAAVDPPYAFPSAGEDDWPMPLPYRQQRSAWAAETDDEDAEATRAEGVDAAGAEAGDDDEDVQESPDFTELDASVEEAAASGTGLPAGRSCSRALPSSEQRDVTKQSQTDNWGLLMNRGEFHRGGATGKKEVLLSGARKDCLADAVTVITHDDKLTVRTFIGDDCSFDRAVAYIATTHPHLALDDVSDIMLEAPGGVAMALLNRESGKFILQHTYTVNGKKRNHCATFEVMEWGPVECFDLATGEVVVKSGRGVFKDNQADVKVHLAEASDCEKCAARTFFAKPYPNIRDIRISRVYELVSAEEGSARAVAREERKCARQQVQGNARAAKLKLCANSAS